MIDEEDEQEFKIKAITDIGDHFGSLTKGKSIHDVILPGLYADSTEVIIRSLRAKLLSREFDVETGLVMAVAWGIYLAELHQTHLLLDLTEVN